MAGKQNGKPARKFLNVRGVSYAVERLAGKTIEAAAVAAGYKATSGKDLEKNPLVQQFIHDYQTRIAEDLAKREAPRLEKAAINRTSILERLWVLSNIDPEVTKGNITGQVNATKELAEIHGMKVNLSADLTREFATRSTEDLEHFAKHGTFVDGSRPNALTSPGLLAPTARA